MRPPRLLPATLTLPLAVALALVGQAAAKEFRPTMPLGLDPDAMNIPAENPLTREKVELGKLLYFDDRLSAAGAGISCATCHDPQKGWAQDTKVSSGVKGQMGARNSPTVLNSAFGLFQFWDGRAATLEEQAKGPIANPIEMGNTHDVCSTTIGSIAGYKPYFKAAFGDETVTIDRIAQAIASFERTVLSGNSAWDRHTQKNDPTALSEEAKRGLALFEGKANCTKCHVGFNLSDGIFHNIGVGMAAKEPDLGRFVVTKKEEDKGAFKTPILRDLQRTGPYMHDGSVPTLQAVIEFYDKGGEPNPWLDPKMIKLGLTPEEKSDLLAFLNSLEGDWQPIAKPTLPQ